MGLPSSPAGVALLGRNPDRGANPFYFRWPGVTHGEIRPFPGRKCGFPHPGFRKLHPGLFKVESLRDSSKATSAQDRPSLLLRASSCLLRGSLCNGLHTISNYTKKHKETQRNTKNQKESQSHAYGRGFSGIRFAALQPFGIITKDEKYEQEHEHEYEQEHEHEHEQEDAGKMLGLLFS